MNSSLSRWELAAESISVRIRWFGILFGYGLVNLGQPTQHAPFLNGILFLGVVYALFDTAWIMRGRIFLRQWPLLISALESLFITLLCFFHTGLESPFRYYYILSLICCAIRYSTGVTYITWAMHASSYGVLFSLLPTVQQTVSSFVLMVVILTWVTWASASLARLLKRVGDHLADLNRELETHRAQLEQRIAERTRDLQQAQAHVLHQEKMATFGLFAAGIAHEVGNPLTSISSLVQILQKRDPDAYTKEKLALVSGQLSRIQNTLRELVNFSRPASTLRTKVALGEVLQEALDIAKYYKRPQGRRIACSVPADLPAVLGVRDQLVQVMLNLVLNAIDATGAGGTIELVAAREGRNVRIEIRDDGGGIAAEHQTLLFQPYFTTKKHGTGLGLFVIRSLVLEHNGEVSFESTLGQGTVFTIRLPTLAEDTPMAEACATVAVK